MATQSAWRNQPTWVDNVVGSKSVIRFDGIDDILNVDSLHVGSETSVFFVARNGTQSSRGESPQYLLTASSDADRDDGNGYGFGYGRSGSPGFTVVQGQGDGGLSRQSLPHRSSPTDEFEIIAYRKANNLAELWRDGMLVATGSQIDPIGGYATGYSIGADPFEKGHQYRGDIAEMLVFQRSLSDEEFAAITKYLEETYSLADQSRQPKLVSYWDFDDRTVDDKTGSNHGIELKRGATFSEDVAPAGGTHNIDFVDSDGSFSGFGADGSAPADPTSAGDCTRSFYDGWMDEVAVWNTVLTPDPVALLAQGQAPPSIPVEGGGLPDVSPVGNRSQGTVPIFAARTTLH